MKKKLTALLCAAGLLTGCMTGMVQAEEAQDSSVVVTMTVSSEPASGFNPVYGWGAGEHVHEPLIQSTLLVTKEDLTIGMDLATEYSVSDDGMTWTVKIRDDVTFTDGEPLTASDVAFTYNTCKDSSSVNDFTMLGKYFPFNVNISTQNLIASAANPITFCVIGIFKCKYNVVVYKSYDIPPFVISKFIYYCIIWVLINFLYYESILISETSSEHF
jgi:ABC-type transport system substrate-binding protein